MTATLEKKLTDKKSAVKKSIGLAFDTSKPVDARHKLLRQMMMASMADPEQLDLFARVLVESHAAAGDMAKFEALQDEYKAVLKELKEGPPQPATFVAMADDNMPGPQPRAHVVLANGQERFPFFQEDVSPIDLEPGMTVYMDNQGATIVGTSRSFARAGTEADFVRALPDLNCIEVAHHEQKFVVYASHTLLDDVQEGKLKRGDSVLWHQRQQFAFASIPQEEDRTYRFVDDSRIPDVDIAREIGNPHPILWKLLFRTKILLTRQDLMERFDLRPKYSVFFTGPSGTGKTLTIKAFLSEFHKMLRDVTGRDDLGSRVIRVKASELLSEWFSVSDRNIDHLFDDLLAVASEEFEINGEMQKIPCVLILEEAEGIIRKRSGGDGRGVGNDGDVYSRVIGTFLQRADDPNDDLSKLPIIWISSTNLAKAVDSAAWRRLCNERAHFTRLDRHGCYAVLEKKLRDNYPYTSLNGTLQADLRRQTIQQVMSWLYSPNGEDQGQVELTFRDGKKQTGFRRHFLTGSLIEQAVSLAINSACEECEQTGDDSIGLDAARITDALANVIDGIADNVTEYNAEDYLDVPENVNIASVRRLRGPQRRLARMAT